MSTHAIAAADAPRAPRARTATEGAWLLSGSMFASGVLTYAFHVLAARTLGPGAYGEVAVLWAALFLVTIVAFRPLEQTASWALSDRLARGEETASVLRAVGVVGAAVLAILLAAFWLARAPLGARLFDGHTLMTGLLAAGVAAYSAEYLVRGAVGGARWFNGYGLALGGDSLARLLVASPLVMLPSRTLAGAAVAAAGLGGAVPPLWRGRVRLRPLLAPGRVARPFRLRSALTYAAPASVIAASDQLLVNGAPLLVVGVGSRSGSTAGIVFAATMLVRGPVYVFQGLAASLLPNLTQLTAADARDRFRAGVARTTLVLLGAGAAILAFAALAGPAAMGVLYGHGFAAGRGQLALLGGGVACYLAAATLSQALLALDRGGRAAAAWIAAAALDIALYVTLPGAQLTRVAVAFLAATLLDLLLLAAALARTLDRA